MSRHGFALVVLLGGCADVTESGGAPSGGAEFVGELETALVVIPDPNDQGVLGSGRNSVTGEILDQCVEGLNNVTIPASESRVSLKLLVSESQLDTYLGVSASAKASFGLLRASARSSFARSTRSAAQSLSFVYRFSGVVDTQKLGAQRRWHVDPPTRLRCGDQYIDQIQRGGELYVLLKMDFASESEKTAFAASLGGNYGAAEVSAAVSASRESFNGRVVIYMEAYQGGGDAAKLAHALSGRATTTSGGNLATRCSVANFSACRAFLDSALEYATGQGPNHFPQTLAAKPAPLSYTLKDWSIISPRAAASIPTRVEIVEARERLFTNHVANLEVINRVDALESASFFGAPASFQTMATNMRTAAKGNLTRIAAGVNLCFDRLSNPVTDAEVAACVQASKAPLAPIDLAALSVKPHTMLGPADALNPRADWVSNIYPGEGHWGELVPWVMCPPGQHVYGYEMRVEAHLGRGEDDTALNWVAMTCGNFERTQTTVIAPTVGPQFGYWGSWRGVKSCAIGPMRGVTIWIEGVQGANGDDTSAGDLSATCVSGEAIQAPGGLRYADTHPTTDACPPGSAICGFRIRVEPFDANGDNTAMNGIQLACCAL